MSLAASALFFALFTEVRGIEILRSSPAMHSTNFAITEFYEVRCQKIATRIATWHMTQPLCPFILALVG
jgi:hypothetical protein